MLREGDTRGTGSPGHAPRRRPSLPPGDFSRAFGTETEPCEPDAATRERSQPEQRAAGAACPAFPTSDPGQLENVIVSQGNNYPSPGRRSVTLLEVHLDSWLREFGPQGNEKVRATSVDQLLDVLETRYPRLRFKLRDETGHLRRYVRVFVDGEDVSGTTGLSTKLNGVRTVDILHSIAGG